MRPLEWATMYWKAAAFMWGFSYMWGKGLRICVDDFNEGRNKLRVPNEEGKHSLSLQRKGSASGGYSGVTARSFRCYCSMWVRLSVLAPASASTPSDKKYP